MLVVVLLLGFRLVILLVGVLECGIVLVFLGVVVVFLCWCLLD